MKEQCSIIQHFLPFFQNSRENIGESKQLILNSIEEKNIYSVLCKPDKLAKSMCSLSTGGNGLIMLHFQVFKTVGSRFFQ